MSASGFALFDTPIGRCGVVWSERGVAGVQLPEANEAATRARLRKRFPGVAEAAPGRDVQRAVAAIGALLAGKASALDDVELDMAAVPEFHRRVYEAARAIP